MPTRQLVFFYTDVINEVEVTKWSPETIFEIPVDNEFIQKYVRAEEWRFKRRLHEVLEHIESVWLNHSNTTSDTTTITTMCTRTQDYFAYPTPADTLSMVDAREVRIGLLNVMSHIALEEVERMELKHKSATTNSELACHKASLDILKDRCKTLNAGE